MNREQGIKKVMGGGGHVVILGAGASIASTLLNPEKHGKVLPSMSNFVSIVGMGDIVNGLPENIRSENFEQLYSNLYAINPNSREIKEIERRVYKYFQEMELPDTPTIYDYLVMSLRSKDLIATFNWDPFLYQAWCRNHQEGEYPHLAFLHGNVAIGYSKEDKKCGPAGMFARREGGLFEPTRLLYPVNQKNYNQDEFIKKEWDRLRFWLSKESKTVRVTIFGYGAPATDIEAMKLMSDSWGDVDDRNMEQFELIDVRSEDELTELWSNFIHTHHYDFENNFFDSILAKFPRRTSERYFHQFLPMTPSEAFQESNPVPNDFKTLEEMCDWFRPLIKAEEEYLKKNKI